MFRGLINDAKSAAASLVARYLARASVAVPFVIAVGFAIAAIAHSVIERFGIVAGCWLLAAGFTLIGLLATLFVKHKEQEDEVADQAAQAADTANVASEVAAQAPLALAGALLSTPIGPKALVDAGKVIMRNLPLVVLLALIALLFWPLESGAAGEDREAGDAPRRPPEGNGAYRPRGNGLHQDQPA
jgi:uncharacterized membrane protein